MLNRNYYKRITESIVKAYRDNNLDSAVEQGEDMDTMGKKIVAIITADPDQDLDWTSEYQPFGATEIEYDECEGEDCDDEQDTCVSCGHPTFDTEEGDDEEENDDMEDIMIGGGFESEDDDMEDMDVKDILVDILHELRGEDDEESEDDFETSDDNAMFGGSDDEESDDDDDDSMLVPQDDWSSDESDDVDDEQEDNYDGEEDNEVLADENGVEMEDVDGMLTASQDEEEVEILDCLDNA